MTMLIIIMKTMKIMIFIAHLHAPHRSDAVVPPRWTVLWSNISLWLSYWSLWPSYSSLWSSSWSLVEWSRDQTYHFDHHFLTLIIILITRWRVLWSDISLWPSYWLMITLITLTIILTTLMWNQNSWIKKYSLKRTDKSSWNSELVLVSQSSLSSLSAQSAKELSWLSRDTIKYQFRHRQKLLQGLDRSYCPSWSAARAAPLKIIEMFMLKGNSARIARIWKQKTTSSKWKKQPLTEAVGKTLRFD